MLAYHPGNTLHEHSVSAVGHGLGLPDPVRLFCETDWHQASNSAAWDERINVKIIEREKKYIQ